ncbi:MAG TPA: PAS domain S-box protein [Bauldia sp.]|nr:PAS domain S-box protein [Bauldia sp.]
MADERLGLLIVEDSEDDTDLLVRELSRGGFTLDYRRVDTPEQLNAALNERSWDLVIADYTMPRFSGAEALSLVRARTSEMPFIFVSGTLGEETAVAALKAGAQDYLVKGKTGRLVPAIQRELREARARRERERLETERRAIEERYRQVLTIAADGIVVIDQERRISIFNRGAERIFGHPAERVTGRPIDLLWPPRLVETSRNRITETLAKGGSASDYQEFVALRASGEEFPVEATFSLLCENGEETITMIVRDIAERKRAERQLRQLSRAVEQSANLVIVTDTHGLIEYVNPRFYSATGYGPDEIIGKRPFFWRSRETGGEIVEQIWSSVLAGVDWRGEIDNVRRDGRRMPVSVTVSPVTNEQGAITQIITIEEDISRRKEIEAQLQQAQKMEAIGQLTGGIAHDFNNLLAIIIGNLDLLASQLKEDEETNAGIQLALAASLRGADLTRQLLAFARQQPLSPRSLDLNRLITHTVAMLRRILGEKVTIEMELAPNLWPVLADPTQVETALTNLAINSRDAMPDGGTLTIATGNRHFESKTVAPGVDLAPGDYAFIAVTDTGAGISPDNLKHVVEPFYTTKAPGKGTGLGLSMAYGFAKQSNGALRVESVVGSGTIVTIYLPRSAEAEAEIPLPESGEETRRGNATILVVEDDPHVQDIVVRQLVGLGYNVHTANDALSALNALRQEAAIDLLFSDVVLPGGITGAALAREARKVQPSLRILLTSGLSDPAGEAEGDPGIAFIGKPYLRLDLARKIETVLATGAEDQASRRRGQA